MKKSFLFLLGISLVIANSCVATATEIQNTKIPESLTPEMTAPEITPTEVQLEDGVYQTDAYSFTVPDGWGLTDSQGAHYDLGVEKQVTIHNEKDPKKSVAFFSVSSKPMADGETLQSLFNAAYKKGPKIENAVESLFERDSLRGIDLTYGRPWGEPRWIFHDVWLENDGVAYVLTFQSYPNSYENHTETFDAVLNSFAFK